MVSQVNNFEQVRGLGAGVPLKSTSLNRSKCDHMGTTLLVDRQTRMKILPSRNFVGGLYKMVKLLPELLRQSKYATE